MSSARLLATRVPKNPEAVVLVLHGGATRQDSPMVSPAQLSVLRMVPIARRLARAGRGRLAVFRVLNSSRGWDTAHTPVDDVRWALGQVADRLGDGAAHRTRGSLARRPGRACWREPSPRSAAWSR